MEHQHSSHITQPANRSIQENHGSRGIQLPSIKVLQPQKNVTSLSVVQGMFTDADESTLNMVTAYIKEKNGHLLGTFADAQTNSQPLTLDSWLTTNMGVSLSAVRSWQGERKEESSMEDISMSASKDGDKGSTPPKITVSPPNSIRIEVGPKGKGVFNLFTYAGKQWIATAYHVVKDIEGKFGKGADSAAAFIAGNKWATAAKEVLKNEDYDYVLYVVEGPEVAYPEIELGTVNRSASETLTVHTPAREKGFTTDTKNVWARKPQKTPEYMYETGIINYAGGKPGDSGSAITNAKGQFVGLHQADFGGIGFKEGAGIFQYLLQQKGK
jgi:S1-C subfamily serine protease